jgi:hypothetical protein
LDADPCTTFNIFGNIVAFALGAACQHDFRKHVSVLGNFVGNHSTHTTGTDYQYFSHFFSFIKIYNSTFSAKIQQFFQMWWEFPVNSHF